jgi:PAS domain S-box-containing protein
MKSQEDSYAQLVEVWSNPALILHSDTREVLAQNSSVSDVFGQEVEWLKIGDQDWQSWWKNPTGKQLFQLNTSSGKSRGFFVRSGALKGVDYIVFEDQLGWRELRNAFEVNKVRYQGLAAGTMEGLAFMQNHQIIDLNTEMMRILGISKLEELAELDVQKLFGPRNWKKMYSRAGHVQEFEFVGLNGKDLVVEGKIELVGESNHSNEVECTLALMDITERKRVEHDLLQTKERFRLLVETSPFGLFLVRNSEVGYANAAALELLGYSDDEDVYGTEFTSLIVQSDLQRVSEDMNQVLQGEKISYSEVTMIGADQEQKSVGIQMTLSFFDKQPAVQISVSDLSTRMELLRQQIRASSAEESNTSLREEIIQHKRTQDQLREAERFNRSIIESSIDMIIAFDNDGKIIQFNHAASVEFGLTIDDAKELHAAQFLQNPDSFQAISERLKEVGYYAGEVTGIRSSEEAFQMLISIAVLHGPDEQPKGFVLVGRDVTDIQLAETELRRSEERYRDILESASDLVFLIDKNGGFTYANPSFYKTLGYRGESIKALNITDILSGQATQDNWMEVITGSSKEVRFKSKTGQELLLIGGGSAQLNSQDEVTGVRCIFLDISEMRAHQLEARQKSAKLESIFNSSRYILMFTINRKLEVTSMNDNVQGTLNHQFGFETALGSPIIDLLKNHTSDVSYKNQFQFFARAFQGVQQQFELPLMNQKKEEVWYQMFVNPVSYGDDHEELSCIAYEITDRKEIDQQVRSTLKEKEILLQEVHHRVKNNLQVISSMLNLQRRFIEDPKMLDILEESQNRISTMSFIHESLYQNSDFSSIGFTEYLKRLTQNLIHSYSRVATGVSLDCVLDDVQINLKQAIPCGLIVNELVSNSLKYAFPNKEGGTIQLRVERKGEDIEIEVSDDGVGLPDDFDFETNESLGVYLVQALTDQLDGTLVVDNNHNENTLEKRSGASFLVRFTPLTD